MNSNRELAERSKATALNTVGDDESSGGSNPSLSAIHLCDYGCGQEAQYQFKNGKWCCSASCNICPSLRHKNSVAIRIVHAKYAHKRKSSKPPWNKGKRYSGQEKIDFANAIRDGFRRNHTINTGKAATEEKEIERRRKISETMRKNKRCGGYRPGSGKAKYGWYKGYWCDSSWELAYTIYNLDHGIDFKRNTKWFLYHNEDGNLVKYYPDYILPDGSFVEIKGRDSYQDWKLKLHDFPKDTKLIIYNYWGMKPFLKYVISKYGKDFTRLYDKK